MCNYCGDVGHDTSICGERATDFLRTLGFFVDFPDEIEANRTAGERRIKEFSERTDVPIGQLLSDFQASFNTTFVSK